MKARRRECSDKGRYLSPTTRAVLALAFTPLLAVGLPSVLGILSIALPCWAITPATGGSLVSCLVGGSMAIYRECSKGRRGAAFFASENVDGMATYWHPPHRLLVS